MSESEKTTFTTLGGSPVPGLTLRQVLRGHKDWIGRIAWSPDGALLASPSADKTIRLWDTRSGECLRVLQGHPSPVLSAAWSPDGSRLASASQDETVRLWDAAGGQCLQTLQGHTGKVNSVAWSPDGSRLASASYDGTVRLWDAAGGQCLQILQGHTSWVNSVAWSPDGSRLVSASGDNTVRLWNAAGGQCLQTLQGHTNYVLSVAWSPDGSRLVSASGDNTVRLWDAGSGKTMQVLEGHTGSVRCAAFSPDGHWLASKSGDYTVYLWRCDTWVCVAMWDEPASGYWPPGLAFHPRLPLLATLGENEKIIRIWELDEAILLGASTPLSASQKSIHYTAAKIVLTGDSGVGKTGLGWRLVHGEFKDHPSTHGQQFWLLQALQTRRTDGAECEAVLWDLAGQADYRLIHGLFLDDADLALLLFNPADSQEPLRGVEFWLNSLPPHCRTILVGARCDRGDTSLSDAEIHQFCAQRGISGYVRTSALANIGLADLLEIVRAQIDWDGMTATVTTQTFKRVKDFVLTLKQDDAQNPRILYDWAALREHLQASDSAWDFSDAEMQTAVGHLARHGYVKILRTSHGGPRVLLRPELLNNLAASFVLEARRNPKGLGALAEREIQANRYNFAELQPLTAEEREILPDAVTVLFLANTIAFREAVGADTYLIFPALINQKKPQLSEIAVYDDMAYSVRGAVENVYAALVVLLGYTNVFTRTNQWQNQAQYEVGAGEICGFRQHAEREGEIELVLYYCQKTSEASRTLFQGLFESFLKQRQVEITRFKPVVCPHCQERQTREAVMARLRKNQQKMFCNDCGESINIAQVQQAIVLTPQQQAAVTRETHAAQQRTRFETALAQVFNFVQEKQIAAPSCFISYAWGVAEHERWVRQFFAPDLRKAGIQIILDDWHNAEIGSDVQRFIDRITKSDSIIVVGTPRYRESCDKEKEENKMDGGSSTIAEEIKLIKAACTYKYLDKHELQDILKKLIPSEFEQVLFSCNIPQAILSGTQTQRAIDVVRYAENCNELKALQACIENQTKIIIKYPVVRPVILTGDQNSALPDFMKTQLYADFRREQHYFRVLFDLILSLYGVAFDDPAVIDLRESLQRETR